MLKAATLTGGGHAVASHRSAARLHRLDGFEATSIIEVSVTRAHRWRHRDSTVAHHVDALGAPDIVVIDGVRCTGLARTLVDVGSVCPDPTMGRRALTDVRRGASLRWVQSTAELLHRPCQRGSGLLSRHLASIPYEGRVPDSWFEELLARCLADSDLGAVVPQYPISRLDGRVVACTDIGLPDVKLGLEGHSRRFHFGPDAEPLDEQRDLAAAAYGWELLYLGWYATKCPTEVLSIVKQVAAARRAPPQPTSKLFSSDPQRQRLDRVSGWWRCTWRRGSPVVPGRRRRAPAQTARRLGHAATPDSSRPP